MRAKQQTDRRAPIKKAPAQMIFPRKGGAPIPGGPSRSFQNENEEVDAGNPSPNARFRPQPINSGRPRPMRTDGPHSEFPSEGYRFRKTFKSTDNERSFRQDRSRPFADAAGSLSKPKPMRPGPGRPYQKNANASDSKASDRRGETERSPDRPKRRSTAGPVPRPSLPSSESPAGRSRSADSSKPSSLARELGEPAVVVDPTEVIRLSKLMTERGLCSRREADDFIARGQVMVDGEVVDTLGIKVTRKVRVELLPQAVSAIQKSVTIILNKPIGYVSGQPEDDYEPAVRLIKPENQEAFPGEMNLSSSHFEGLAPAGRLDIDSQGLLVFTQNGTVAKLLIGEDSHIEKEYLVRVTGSLPEFGLRLLNHGLALDGQALEPALVEWINEDQLRFVLREGKKRQIRRMCEAVGLTVAGLKRVRIGNVPLGNLPEGHWRFLQPNECF